MVKRCGNIPYGLQTKLCNGETLTSYQARHFLPAVCYRKPHSYGVWKTPASTAKIARNTLHRSSLTYGQAVPNPLLLVSSDDNARQACDAGTVFLRDLGSLCSPNEQISASYFHCSSATTVILCLLCCQSGTNNIAHENVI